MRCLVYRSKALVDPGSDACRSIVDVSRTNNAREGLTGFLHAEPGLFVQYIEGPARPLHSAFSRIRIDPRHTGLQLLGEGPIVARRFRNWDMGYSSTDILLLADFLHDVTGRPLEIAPSGAETLYFLMAASQRVDLGITRSR